MWDVFNITAPVFIIIALGYFAVRFEMFEFSQLQGAAKFVMKIGLPALVFHAVAPHPIEEVFDRAYMGGYGLATLSAFAVGWAVGRWLRRQDGVQAALSGFGMSMSNTGFIGYPLLAMVIGTPAGKYLAMNALIENVIALPLFFIVADAARSQNGNCWQMLVGMAKNLARNPIILAIPISLLFAVGGIPVPTILERVTAMLASASAPVALFVIGGGLYGLRIQGALTDVCLLSFGKLAVFPSLTALGLWLCGADHATLFAGVLLASAPMASMFPLLGVQYGHERYGTAGMLLTTCLSFISISVVLLLH